MEIDEDFPLPEKRTRTQLFEGAVFHLSLRRINPDGTKLWTASIENVGKQHLLQCELKLQGDFQPINHVYRSIHNIDRQIQAMLYRNVHQYGAGHGCSVQWDETSEGVKEIRSSFLPRMTVPQMVASTIDDFHCFHMSAWKDTCRGKSLDELEEYVRSYSDWTHGQKIQSQELTPVYQEAAKHVLDGMAACISRMGSGISTLRKDDIAWEAFKFTNEAMLHQSARKRGVAEDEVTWYPFQLCYLLMCIPDIVDMDSQWHDVVDLLWFPTGGGKTEAYLGVAAFCIFYRRLRYGDAGRGVTALMRYTLRMLTAQQFERAASLICECELIRRREQLPGGEISIGLWVGSSMTPNHVESSQPDMEDGASAILKKLKAEGQYNVGASPVQLVSCPHCGEALDILHAYKISERQFKTLCPNPACPFHDDLPVMTVDDDIYNRRPTLLIGTIDKFARLPWEERTKMLFAEDGYGMPPSLLIQDELHLISGPLGSISGLYENMIDILCMYKGKGPKILASTATLNNAEKQIRALYRRQMFQFPPSGLNADDSFFARRATPDERPERLYTGFCEMGGSQADAIVRVFGTISFGLQYLRGKGFKANVIDQFWTNIGYFNALKDLGSANTIILDRVRNYAESLRVHKFHAEAEEADIAPFDWAYEADELTSRKRAYEIMQIRTRLDRDSYPSEGAYSYVLSSNMLSVGIDIKRLGLMTVYGQPKLTAEYIQATSRVGRSNPGFIIILLNGFRTRDKGHFEQFQSIHQTLNGMVEPTSAMPYASRTLEKALHAVFIGLVRHMCPDLSSNDSAGNFRRDREDVRMIYQTLLRNIQENAPDSLSYADELLDDFTALWERKAIDLGGRLVYSVFNEYHEGVVALLVPAEKSEDSDFPPTMNSMREVATPSGVYMIKRKNKSGLAGRGMKGSLTLRK